MLSEPVVILGIPIDNLTMEETIERIFSMIESYRHDLRPRLVATVNVDFVVNTLTWRLSRIRHPELLEILRGADLVTADGMPLVVISKLLGCPLKERVTGADLVPKLAENAAKRGKSLYFLGGREDVAKSAAALLQERYPGLPFAGIDSPFVYIQGENLSNAEEVDREIVQRINDARPDILLIAFGNPKQEVWFNRNRGRLRVPVSIGIGGTFEFIAGSVRRAPVWMQRTGLEWLFRITQDPGRLWKRYLVGFLKFGLMVWPAVLYYRYQRLMYRTLCKGADELSKENSPGPGSASTGLQIVALPERLDMNSLGEISEQADRLISRSEQVAFDFASVRFIDSTGLGFLVRTLRRAEREGRELYLIGIASKVRSFFALNRTWDLFEKKVRGELQEVITEMRALQKLPPFSYVLTHRKDFSVMHLIGRLDAQTVAGLDMHVLTGEISGRDCILNLDRLEFVDSSGLIVFFKIQKHQVQSGRRCVLCTLSANVKQLFRLTKLNQLFRIAPDLSSAQQMLEEPL